MDGKPPPGDIRSPGMSPAKVKLRDARGKNSMSRIKKLKKRLSASFGRLSVSRDETGQERISEDARYSIINGNQSDSPTRGYHLQRDVSQSPPVFFSQNSTPDRHPVPHPLINMHQMAQSMDEGVINHNGHYANGHYGNSSSHPGSSEKMAGAPVGCHGKSGNVTSSCHVHIPHNGLAAVIDQSNVKRHHSTGDVLDTSRPTAVLPPHVHVITRSRRPKSEGNFQVEAFRSKRASSFGYNSPFGKEDAYEKLDQLGEGSYATVFRGKSLLTNKVVALKEIQLQHEEGTPFTAIREASLLKGLKHANIVTLHDIIHTKETLTFVFEFVHTDLSQYLERHAGGLNPRNVKLFLFQLLRGLSFCHCRQILHRDLKPQNLLISEIGELKLADFGLARAKSIPSRTYSHEVVTLWYRPPDVLLGSTDYTTSLDMWGVGCIFTEMVSGLATFPGMKDAYDQLDRIWRVLGTPSEDVWKGVTHFPNYCTTKFGFYHQREISLVIPKLAHIPHAETLATSLLQLMPQQRITAAQALVHHYFSDLPPVIYELPDVASIFNIPGMRLAPEMDELLRTHIRTNPHVKKL